MEKLKPCPFCGGKAILEHSHLMPYVKCINLMCDVQPWTKCEYTDDEAIEAWNRRSNDV